MNDFIAAYLERLDMSTPDGNDPAALARLQEAHLRHIPYENIDIWRGKEVALDIGSIFEKIILRKRGGYCFELNGLFAELLRQLGYPVKEYFARWHLGEKSPLPMRRHRVLAVECDGRTFLADAGVGCSCPLQPLELRIGTEQTSGGAYFRLDEDPRFGYVVMTGVDRNAELTPFYSFTADPHFPQDFVYVNYYCTHMPESPFRLKPMAHIHSGAGRKSIAGELDDAGQQHVILTLPAAEGGITRTELCGDAAIDAALAAHFGIVVPQDGSGV